jgi:hypothetical protein
MNSLTSVIKRHPLATFFILAYACSWWSVPLDGTQFAFGPLIAAIVVSGLIGGKAELMAWVRRRLRWLAGLGWYVLALLLPFGINATAAVLAVLLGAPLRTPANSHAGPSYLSSSPSIWSHSAHWARSRAGVASPCHGWRHSARRSAPV